MDTSPSHNPLFMKAHLLIGDFEVIPLREAKLHNLTKLENGHFHYGILGRRGGDADIEVGHIEDRQDYSRNHACLGWYEPSTSEEAGYWALKPLCSSDVTNIVYRNKQALQPNQWHRLVDGDRILLGCKVEVTFTLASEVEYDEPPIATERSPSRAIHTLRVQRYSMEQAYKALESLWLHLEAKTDFGERPRQLQEGIGPEVFQLFQRTFGVHYLELAIHDPWTGKVLFDEYGGNTGCKGEQTYAGERISDKTREQDLALEEEVFTSDSRYQVLGGIWHLYWDEDKHKPLRLGHLYMRANQDGFSEPERFSFEALFALCGRLLRRILRRRTFKSRLQRRIAGEQARKLKGAEQITAISSNAQIEAWVAEAREGKGELKFQEDLKALAVLPLVQQAERQAKAEHQAEVGVGSQTGSTNRVKGKLEKRAGQLLGCSDKTLRNYHEKIKALLGYYPD